MKNNKQAKYRDEGFGLRFRLLLGYHNMTLKDVSLVTGCAISTVSTWKSGRIPASKRKIEEIARLFHVSPAYLIYGVDSVNATKKDFVQGGLDQVVCAQNEDLLKLKKTVKIPENLMSKKSLRKRIEMYFASYLDAVEKIEGGLEHTWFELLGSFSMEKLDQVEKYFSEHTE